MGWGGAGNIQAYLWQGAGATVIGPYSPPPFSNQGTAINAAGTVVVNTDNNSFVWRGGVLIPLRRLVAGQGTLALGINNSGQVVGENFGHAVRWDNEIPTDLGVMAGGTWSSANAINDAGQVVGNGSTSGSASAFLWSSATGMVDVNSLVLPGSGARVLDATAINENGQIVGRAVFAGGARAALLNPTGTLAWTGAGAASGSGSFADGRNWELGFVPSRLVDLMIAPTSSATVLGPTGDIAGKSLTVGGASNVPATLQLQGGRITLDGGNGLATIEANATLNGTGTFAGALVNRGSIAVSQLAVSQGVFNQASGRIEGGRIATPYGVFNDGLISGSVRLDAAVENHGNTPTTGLHVGAGEHMTMTGLINDGRVEVLGGAMSNSGSAVNEAAGALQLRNAVLRTDQGLANRGQINVSFGATDIFGTLSNQGGGKIVLSGNSNTTFFDAVEVQSGAELRVSAGSAAVFFGQVLQRTGAVFSGTGAKFFEGGLSVGASPGLGQDAGSVSFGAGSEYLAEIGGLAAGTQFDRSIVGGKLSFGGRLKLVSWAGYTAQAGDTFNLFDWGQSAGSFDAIDASGLMLASGTQLDTSQLYVDGSLHVVAVPEPQIWALLLAGLWWVRRAATAQRQVPRPSR